MNSPHASWGRRFKKRWDQLTFDERVRLQREYKDNQESPDGKAINAAFASLRTAKKKREDVIQRLREYILSKRSLSSP
jgi:hypothetical protein